MAILVKSLIILKSTDSNAYDLIFMITKYTMITEIVDNVLCAHVLLLIIAEPDASS